MGSNLTNTLLNVNPKLLQRIYQKKKNVDYRKTFNDSKSNMQKSLPTSQGDIYLSI